MFAQSFQTWKQAINTGLITGGVTILLALVGLVETFSRRFIIAGVLSMGQVFFLAPVLVSGYALPRRFHRDPWLSGLITGVTTGLTLSVFLLIGENINLRQMFINATQTLYNELTFGAGFPTGYLVPILYGTLITLVGVGLYLLPGRLRSALTNALIWVVLLGLMRDLIVTVISNWGDVATLFRWLFAQSGMSAIGAVLFFALIAGLNFWRSGRTSQAPRKRFSEQPPALRWGILAGGALILLLLPQVLGIFFSEILDNVGLYTLMALGLNIVVGFAGLLDLGYVAFFAIGAYVVGVLTSTGLGFFNLTFWEALPFALLMGVFSGVVLGLPVLRMRGDYLAIVTLGFGEIVRLIVLSDWLRPYLGGTQGIQSIAQPIIGPIKFDTQGELYYLILVGCFLVGAIAWRLKDSRLGRAWMALREDEDVAQAMGMNLVATKLLAFATGATFASLSGALFAAKLTSAYPHSFKFLVSINVLSVIIVGGMGSIPGVLLGAIALVGLPDLLREFAEYRYLVYGAVLVAVMLLRPEGLWPEERRKLELHESEEELVEEAPEKFAPVTGTTD